MAESLRSNLLSTFPSISIVAMAARAGLSFQEADEIANVWLDLREWQEDYALCLKHPDSEEDLTQYIKGREPIMDALASVLPYDLYQRHDLKRIAGLPDDPDWKSWFAMEPNEIAKTIWDYLTEEADLVMLRPAPVTHVMMCRIDDLPAMFDSHEVAYNAACLRLEVASSVRAWDALVTYYDTAAALLDASEDDAQLDAQSVKDWKAAETAVYAVTIKTEFEAHEPYLIVHFLRHLKLME